MKRLTTILSLMCFILMFTMTNVNAKENTYTLEMEVVNNEKEDINLYILLPKEYILYAIAEDNLNIEYTGADTLIENDIPSINVSRKNVQSEVYEEDEVEYIQILLEKNRKGIYEFEILSEYKNMNMKYRVKNEDKDYIMHIDNFKIENWKCKIIYDYEKETVKQPTQAIITTTTKFYIFLLIIIITLGIISYFKQRR